MATVLNLAANGNWPYLDRHVRQNKAAGIGAAVPVTVGVDAPNGLASGLLVGTGGTATIIDDLGQTRTNVILQAGYNPIYVRQVVSLGTAANLWYLT